jgi:hypothetical protein
MPQHSLAFDRAFSAAPSHDGRPIARDGWTTSAYVFVCVWTIAWFTHGWRYWEDDAFIHLEYARSLSEGRGFEFNGLVSYGDTSPLWALLLVSAHAVWPDWIVAGKLLMAISIVAAFAAIRELAMAIAPDAASSRARFATLMVLLTALNPYFLYWSSSGMEAVLAIAVALWILRIATVGPVARRSLWIGSLLAGLAPLLRPELIFLDMVVAPFFLKRALELSGDRPAVRRLAFLLFTALLGVGPLAAWLLYAHHAFGTIVPNTSAAKGVFDGASVPVRIATVMAYGFPVVTLTLLAVPVVTALRLWREGPTLFWLGLRRTPSAVWAIIAWTLATLGFYILNRTYVQTRYVLVFAPALTIAVYVLFSALGRKTYMTASILAAATSALVSLAVAGPYIANKARLSEESDKLSAFILAHVPAKEPIAVYAIGEIAFKTRRPVVDTGGITRPSVIPLMTSPQSVVEWAKHEGAAYFISPTPPQPDAIPLYEARYRFAEWTLDIRKFRETQSYYLWSLPPTDTAKGR